MSLDIDPKVDYAFKHLFGRESTVPLLIDLLDAVLSPPPGRHIREVELLNPFNPKESLDDKLSILDVKARDESGRQINIEMQMRLNPFFKSRIVYYLAKFHQQQLHEGEDYTVLKPTISMIFLNQTLFPDIPDCHLRFRLLEERHHFPFADDLELHTLELPKFQKTEPELTSGLDIWLYFLRHAEKMNPEALPAPMRGAVIQRAVEELTMLTQTEIERERYEARRKAQLDHNTEIKVARMEGLAEGLTEGEKKGRAEGEKIGVIHAYEGLLGRPQTPAAELVQLSLAELTRRAEELLAQLRNPR